MSSRLSAGLAILLAASGCCVVIVDGQSTNGGANPFQQNPQGYDAGPTVAIASCRVVPVDAGIGQLITFDGSGSEPSPDASTIVTWAWAFGDGTRGLGSLATHEYYDAGVFTASLEVTDDQGTTATASCPGVAVR